MIDRKKTNKISIGNLHIGGDSPISVQSMCNVKTEDREACVEQINQLDQAGCDIIRVAVPDIKSAMALRKIKDNIKIPLVADIHFDYRLAVLAAENGADKLRINPGNIGSKENLKIIVDAAKTAKIPIRVGSNSGSVSKELLMKHGAATPQAIVEAALEYVKMLEGHGFYDIVVALKSSNVMNTIISCQLFSSMSDYPLHLGVTEAGLKEDSLIKSSLAIGTLLMQGIGDTLRVSITGNKLDEIFAGKAILRACGIIDGGIELITCPTCSRTHGNLLEIAKQVKEKLPMTNKKLVVAIMGCEVNGPGEARAADIGMTLGKSKAILFKNGEVYKTVAKETAVDELINEVNLILSSME